MNGGIVPLMLLSAAIGFALAFTSMRWAWVAAALFGATALAVSFVAFPGSGDAVVFGLLISTAVTAALVYLPRGVPRWLAIVAALNDGVWMGLHGSVSLQRSEVVWALPLVLLFIPGKWIIDHEYSIAIKVICSWLIAIAALAIFVSLVPTPGYKPDHME